MNRMIPSSEKGLARSETRKRDTINQTALVAAGLESVSKGVDPCHVPISRQPVATKAVFLCLRFHKTAKKRQQVRYPCSGVLVRIIRGLVDLICKRVMAALLVISKPITPQPEGSLIQAKLIGQTSKPSLALGRLAPCCQDDEQKALDKIDESLASRQVHHLGR